MDPGRQVPDQAGELTAQMLAIGIHGYYGRAAPAQGVTNTRLHGPPGSQAQRQCQNVGAFTPSNARRIVSTGIVDDHDLGFEMGADIVDDRGNRLSLVQGGDNDHDATEAAGWGQGYGFLYHWLMRVLHLGKFYPPHPGGMETFMRDLLLELVAADVECAAVVHEIDRSAIGHRHDGALQVWHARSYGNLLYAPVSPGFGVQLAEAIDRFRPDILHLHLPNTSALWALATPAARRIPWVVHWHADVITPLSRGIMRLAYRLYRPFEQAVLGHARAIIATSPPYLATSAPLARWRHQCHCIPLGLDMDCLPHINPADRAWAEAQWLPGRRRVLSVGRLSHYKGFGYLVDAAQQLPECHCLIVGDGEMRADLAGKIAARNVGGQVQLAGRLAAGRLHALLESCEVFCLPSIERTEAFGLVLVEAMAYAKPLVASDIAGSGVGWVVQQGKNGLLAEPMNPTDLTDKIRAALDIPGLGSTGTEIAKTTFSISQVAGQVRQLYEQILDRG